MLCENTSPYIEKFPRDMQNTPPDIEKIPRDTRNLSSNIYSPPLLPRIFSEGINVGLKVLI